MSAVSSDLGGDNLISQSVDTLNYLEPKSDFKKTANPCFKIMLVGVVDFAYRRPDGIFIVLIG